MLVPASYGGQETWTESLHHSLSNEVASNDRLRNVKTQQILKSIKDQ